MPPLAPSLSCFLLPPPDHSTKCPRLADSSSRFTQGPGYCQRGDTWGHGRNLHCRNLQCPMPTWGRPGVSLPHRKWLLLCRAAKDCVAHLHLPGTSRILSLSKETTVSRREARQTLYSTHSVFTVTCGTSSREINDAFDVSASNVNLPSTHLVFEYHPAPPDT